MATMIDQRPSFQGEALLWDRLRDYLPDQDVVYNNREINGREFDTCVLLGNVGILIIEVKGWHSSSITVNGVDEILVDGYAAPQRSPKKQARAYRFAMLNRVKEKYNVSPLVFDMVCYPFISKKDYYEKRLDIISEERFTIFQEDLENSSIFIEKIHEAYDTVKSYPHFPMTIELAGKIRQEWEPNYHPIRHENTVGETGLYSVLKVYPAPIDEGIASDAAKAYFAGIKQIVFVPDRNSFDTLIKAFNHEYAAHNIQPKGNQLSIGFTGGLKPAETTCLAFNLEIELCPDIASICNETVTIQEGRLYSNHETILKQLAEKTEFNYQQYRVEHAASDHNILVEAGAGTGKTYSMVSRVAYLCNKIDHPVLNIAEEIGMVTFTNDAASNMKARLKQMFTNYFVLTGESRFLKLLEDTDRACISTIHSFALDLLRKESLYTGLGTNFRITSNEYLRSQIYDTYLNSFLVGKEENEPDFANTIPVPVYDLKKKIIAIADRLLAKSVDLDQITITDMGALVDNNIPYFNDILESVMIPAEHEYFVKLHEINNLDLKESLILLNKVLMHRLEKLRNIKIRYLFIDEFQDTDDIQIEVFQMLQKAIDVHCALFVVGDLKQSIYRFRGAKLSAFHKLKGNCLYDWERYHLNINYRTDGRLLDLYDDIFSSMGEQNYLPYSSENDRLISRIDTGISKERLLNAVPCHGKDEEVLFETFVNLLRRERENLMQLMGTKEQDGIRLNENERTIAILVRSNWQVEKLIEAAKKRGMHIDTKTGGDLFQLPSTLDLYKLASALIYSTNPLNLISFIESDYTNLKLDYHLYHGQNTEDILKDLERILDEFFTIRMGMTWRQVKNMACTEPVLSVLKKIYDALQPWQNYSASYQEQHHYMANYDYLLERIIKYARVDSLTLSQITEYLRINIVTGQQQLSRDDSYDNGEIRMICTTVHKSKGLEYGTVILPYTDEEIDNPRKIKTDANYMQSKLAYTVLFENKLRESNSNYNFEDEVNEQIAEEARILYVALTRAIHSCVWIKNLDSQPRVSWSTLLEEQ